MKRQKIKFKNSIIIGSIALVLIIIFIIGYLPNTFNNNINKIRRLVNEREIKEYNLLDDYGVLQKFKKNKDTNIYDAEIYFTKGFEKEYIGKINYDNKESLLPEDMVKSVNVGENKSYHIYILKCNEIINEKSSMYRNIPIPFIAHKKSFTGNKKDILIDLRQHVFFHIFNDDDIIKNAKIEYMKSELATFNNANLFKESFYALSRENDCMEGIFYTINNYLEGKRKPFIFNNPKEYISNTNDCNRLNEEYEAALKEILNSNEYKDLKTALSIKNKKNHII